MAQFVVHLYDEQLGTPVPAYSVAVANGRAYVSPHQGKWAEAARRLEDALNGQRPPGREVQRDAQNRQTMV